MCLMGVNVDVCSKKDESKKRKRKGGLQRASRRKGGLKERGATRRRERNSERVRMGKCVAGGKE